MQCDFQVKQETLKCNTKCIFELLFAKLQMRPFTLHFHSVLFIFSQQFMDTFVESISINNCISFLIINNNVVHNIILYTHTHTHTHTHNQYG